MENLDWIFWIIHFENLDLENGYPIHKIYKMQIILKSKSNKINFKWIEFLIKQILNRLNQRKNRMDHEN